MSEFQHKKKILLGLRALYFGNRSVYFRKYTVFGEISGSERLHL
jgi:hypothetical protein